MNTLSCTIAFGPLAFYFLALAALNSGRRSRVVSGQRDLLALTLGLIGFVLIGPVMMFLPVDALGFWKIITWPMLAILYTLVIVFISSMFPPRLIVYNISAEELRTVLSTLTVELDQESRWCGNSFVIPGLGIQFYLEKSTFFRNIAIIATGTGQDSRGWVRLEKALTTALSRHQTSSNRVGTLMMILGLGIGLAIVFSLYFDSQAVIATLYELLTD